MFKVLKLYFPEPGEPDGGNPIPPKEDKADDDYLDIIENLKSTTVEKEKYDKLEEKYKEALKVIATGEKVDEEPGEVVKPDINKIKKALFVENNDMSNLEYATLVLQYRNAMIEEEGIDPFLPSGSGVSATNDDIVKADHVAQVFEQCIEGCDGDSELFTAMLQSRTNDAAPLKKTLRRR